MIRTAKKILRILLFLFHYPYTTPCKGLKNILKKLKYVVCYWTFETYCPLSSYFIFTKKLIYCEHWTDIRRIIFRNFFLLLFRIFRRKTSNHHNLMTPSIWAFREMKEILGTHIFIYINIFLYIFIIWRTMHGSTGEYRTIAATELTFSYSFTRVNNEFYERRGYELRWADDGRCNSLRRRMTRNVGNVWW